jgi:hypothetical protein
MQIIAKQLVRQIRFPGLSGLCGRAEWLPVTVVITLGTALRIWSPAMRSELWYDEAYSLTVARQSFGRMAHLLLVGGDTNPPLYTGSRFLYEVKAGMSQNRYLPGNPLELCPADCCLAPSITVNHHSEGG